MHTLCYDQREFETKGRPKVGASVRLNPTADNAYRDEMRSIEEGNISRDKTEFLLKAEAQKGRHECETQLRFKSE